MSRMPCTSLRFQSILLIVRSSWRVSMVFFRVFSASRIQALNRDIFWYYPRQLRWANVWYFDGWAFQIRSNDKRFSFLQEHERKLREHSHHSESLIARALDRVEMYAEVNRQKPGFFDMTFVSGEWVKKSSLVGATELYLIYLEVVLSNKRRSKKTWRIWMLSAADWRRK